MSAGLLICWRCDCGLRRRAGPLAHGRWYGGWHRRCADCASDRPTGFDYPDGPA